MSATYVRVKTEDQQKHRSLSTILEIFKNLNFAPPVREHAYRHFSKTWRSRSPRARRTA